MLDYAVEAAAYDETRGGQPRAVAAAEAVLRLRPEPGLLLDVGGGTGIVSAAVAAAPSAKGRAQVAVLDAEVQMLRYGAQRLPGRAVACDAGRLPVVDASVDTVCFMWLLHLLPDAGPAVREAARVLRAGGALVTTVDKAQASGIRRSRPASDERSRVVALAGEAGLVPDGETTYVGVGQHGEPGYTVIALRKDRIVL